MTSPSYGEVITLINKLDAKHAALKQDAYYPIVIHGCMWSESFERSVGNDGRVLTGTLHKVQVPTDSAEFYVPYREWKSMESHEGYFTLRTGDYVVRGMVDGPINASTIRTITADYEPDAFAVKSWRELTVVEEIPNDLSFAFALEG